MLISKRPNYLLLKASLVLTLIFFSFYLLYQLDLIALIIESDRSKISLLILAIYFLSTIHWFYIAISLDKEISSLDDPSSKTLIGRLLSEKNKSQEVILEMIAMRSIGRFFIVILALLSYFKFSI